MSRKRFFVSPEGIREGVALLPPDQAHHLRHVLRLQPESAVEVFDGQGRGYCGVVEFAGSAVRVVSLRSLPSRGGTAPFLTLGMALIKADRMEMVLQKGTELGADEFVPLISRHCSVRVQDRKLQERIRRWERIVREAAKQCRRLTLPAVGAPIEFERFVAERTRPGFEGFLWHEKAAVPWRAAPPATGQVGLCIGPEGGWDPSEVSLAESAGWKIFRLGDTILRAETAAIAAVALFRFSLPAQGPSGSG
ncbi:MAG: RsmE family RNA methyltransferase [Acidobacteriota bacterium]